MKKFTQSHEQAIAKERAESSAIINELRANEALRAKQFEESDIKIRRMESSRKLDIAKAKQLWEEQEQERYQRYMREKQLEFEAVNRYGLVAVVDSPISENACLL